MWRGDVECLGTERPWGLVPAPEDFRTMMSRLPTAKLRRQAIPVPTLPFAAKAARRAEKLQRVFLDMEAELRLGALGRVQSDMRVLLHA